MSGGFKPEGAGSVMASRHEPDDSLDFFGTPPWATRALCLWLRQNIGLPPTSTSWDPACGENDMVRPLNEFFCFVAASDVVDYGQGVVSDFLWPGSQTSADWLITNPPFRLADQFALQAIRLMRVGCALLVRTSFLEGGERYATLFRPEPPSEILQFVERVPMVKGRARRFIWRIDERTGLWKRDTISTATSYCWLIWRFGAPAGTAFHWIAPCRRNLERDSDYPTEAIEAYEAARLNDLMTAGAA